MKVKVLLLEWYLPKGWIEGAVIADTPPVLPTFKMFATGLQFNEPLLGTLSIPFEYWILPPAWSSSA